MQDQVLTEFQTAAGLITEPIGSADETYWASADKVRFRFNKPELMGGWVRTAPQAQTSTLLGQPRVLETVRSYIGVRAAVVGTDIGLFASDLSQYKNVTPVVTAVATAGVYNTSVGSTKVVISVSNHGFTNNSIVGIVSATATIGDTIILNATATTTALFQVSVIDSHSFEIDAGTTAAATSANTGNASTIIIHYPAGRASQEISGGWGGGVWDGAFGWDEPTGTGIILGARTWSMDAWGTELMAVPSQGPLYLYSPQNGIFTNFAIVTAAPSVNEVVRVAVEARHVILYGTHDVTGLFDPLYIRWCSQEDYDDWTPTALNTAGDFRLNSTGSQIVGVEKMRDQYLIFTDYELFLQTYIGSNDVFGFARAAENCGLLARNAAAEYGGAVFWMGNNGQFYKYDGRVQPLQCTVLRYVYDNLHPDYLGKVYAGTNSQFDEVIWLYTSRDSVDGENDRYVIFNPVENHWTIGSLRRNVWKDRSAYNNIIAAGGEGEGLFYHEVGESAGEEVLEAFIESNYFDLQDGDDILFCNKIVPEFENPSGDEALATVDIYLKSRKYPGGQIQTKGPYSVTGATQRISTRARGREMAIRLESNTQTQPIATGSGKWRMSSMRLGLQKDGKR